MIRHGPAAVPSLMAYLGDTNPPHNILDCFKIYYRRERTLDDVLSPCQEERGVEEVGPKPFRFCDADVGKHAVL